MRRRQPNADGHSHTDGNADSYSYSHGNANTDANADSHSRSHGDGYFNTYCNAYARGQTYADAQAAAAASSPGGALIGTVKAGNSQAETREFPSLRWQVTVAAVPHATPKLGEGGLPAKSPWALLWESNLVAAEASWEICGEKIQNNVDTLLRIQVKRGFTLRQPLITTNRH